MKDYSKTIFDQGIVCMNTNNNRHCVVINGIRGTENDRASLVIEQSGEDGFIIHTPPNRALIPTGKICRLDLLRGILDHEVAERKEIE